MIVACVTVAMGAGSASASASTLALSASQSSSQDGSLSATITAVGTVDPTTFGGSDELDIFTASSDAPCASTAEAEDESLGFPGFDTAPYPGLAYVSGSFSQSISFDSGKSAGGDYRVCGYLTNSAGAGATTATATTIVTLVTPPAAIGSLSLHLSSRNVEGRQARIVVTTSGSLSSTAAPATLAVDLEYPPCSPRDDFLSGSGVAPADFLRVLKSSGSFRHSFVFRPFYDQYFSSGGKVAVCAYLGEPSNSSDPTVTNAFLYDWKSATFHYKAPPQPKQRPSKPKPLTQLQRIENAVTHAVEHEPSLDIYGPDTYYVVSCRKVGPSSWTCTLETNDLNVYPRLQVTVREINGRYYVGEFHHAP
jgi:hypothetical protein